MTGVSKNTAAKLLVELGATCTKYQDATLRNLSCKRLQCDEIWSFVGGKDKKLSRREKKEKGLGSLWTWTAVDADTVDCLIKLLNGGGGVPLQWVHADACSVKQASVSCRFCFA